MTDLTAVNVAIAEALGLDPTKIAKGGVTIRLEATGPEVDVTYRDLIRDGPVNVLKHYRLVPIDD